MNNKQKKLLTIIKNKGNCMELMCRRCPLATYEDTFTHCLVVRQGKYKEEDIYKKAIEVYTQNKYDEVALVEVLL